MRTRSPLSLLVAGALALTVGACGSDGDSASPEPESQVETTEPTEPTEADESDADPFPVSIESKFGTAVIESRPERVVSIGYTDGDYILAIGVTPVAIRDWYGEQPGGLWPWAHDAAAADDSIEVLQPDEINFERVAALQPDVIIAMVSEIEQADYDRLSEIAPVVAQTDAYIQYGTPWDEVQLTIGRALGLEAEAQAVVDDVRGQIAAAAGANPGWAGQTANFVVPAAGGTWYAYTDQDTRGRLLTQLGFTISPEIVELAGDRFYAEGSAETIALVDADLLAYNVFGDENRAAVDEWALWQAIPAVADGRAVYVDDGLAGAMSFSTTLSLPYAVDALVPLIRAALGD